MLSFLGLSILLLFLYFLSIKSLFLMTAVCYLDVDWEQHHKTISGSRCRCIGTCYWQRLGRSRNISIAGAAAFTPVIDKGLRKIQKYFKFQNLVYAFGLVVAIVAACLTAVGLLILSRWGKWINGVGIFCSIRIFFKCRCWCSVVPLHSCIRYQLLLALVTLRQTAAQISGYVSKARSFVVR